MPVAVTRVPKRLPSATYALRESGTIAESRYSGRKAVARTPTRTGKANIRMSVPSASTKWDCFFGESAGPEDKSHLAGILVDGSIMP
jgi:hypothetical protein